MRNIIQFIEPSIDLLVLVEYYLEDTAEKPCDLQFTMSYPKFYPIKDGVVLREDDECSNLDIIKSVIRIVSTIVTSNHT